MEQPSATPARLTAFQPVLPSRDLHFTDFSSSIPSDKLEAENARLRKALGLVVAEAMAKARDLQAARKECEDLQAKLQQISISSPLESTVDVQQKAERKLRSPKLQPPTRSASTVKPYPKTSVGASRSKQLHNKSDKQEPVTQSSPGYTLFGTYDAAFVPSSPPKAPTRKVLDESPVTLQASDMQPAGRSQKLRVRVSEGQALVCMQAADAVAASIMRSTMSSASPTQSHLVEQATGSMLTSKAKQAGIRVAEDGVMLCPLALYVSIARGGDPSQLMAQLPKATESANEGASNGQESAVSTLPPPASAPLRRKSRSSSTSSSSTSSDGAPAHAVQKASPPLSAQTARTRNGSAFGASAGKQAAHALLSAPMPPRPASSASNKAPVPHIRRASAHSKSTASSPLEKAGTPAASVASAAVTLAQGGMLENPLMAARNNRLAGVAAHSSPPQASPDSRTSSSRRKPRQKPQLPHRAEMLDTGAKSTNGVGEKLRKSLGSSYRSVPVVGLSFEAKAERVRRKAPDDLLSQLSSQDSEDGEDDSGADEEPLSTHRKEPSVAKGRGIAALAAPSRRHVRSASPRSESDREGTSPSQQAWRRPQAKVQRPQSKPAQQVTHEASGKVYRPSHSGLVAATQALDPMRHLHSSLRTRLLASQQGTPHGAAGSVGKSLGSKEDDGHVSSPSSGSPQRAFTQSFSTPPIGLGMRHTGYTWSAPRRTAGEGSAVALIEDGDAALRAALAKVKGSLDKSVAEAVAASGLHAQDN